MSQLLSGPLAQRVRLVSGLILFAFAATHFLNHAVGLIGVEEMEAVRGWRLTVTRSLPGGIILGLALLIHMILALAKLAGRRTAKMPLWEAVQIGLGLFIPFFLFPHIVNTRFANELFGVNDSYVYELLQLWPLRASTQSLLLLVVWVHSCVGLHYWLRLSPLYRRLQPLALSLAVLVPSAALAGFMVAGRDVQAAAADPLALEAMRQQTQWPKGEALDWLLAVTPVSYYAFYPFLIAALLVALTGWAYARLSSNLAISYVPSPDVKAAPGATLLEISRANNIPHTSICGGRARCSTCRVEIIEGLDALPPPDQAERETLERIAAPHGVRLACQVRPNAPVKLRLLVHPGAGLRMERSEALGVERTMAVLFMDIRGFTNWSQSKLPYDVVFVLNRTFAAAGDAITAERGWVDKYMGDGLMAVFGHQDGADVGCAHALAAARAIDLAMEELNRDLKAELGDGLKLGIGIHVGPLVLGEIGHEASAAMTVIGRSVNTASRLEAMTKEHDCQLIVTREVLTRAGVATAKLSPKALPVRGLDDPLEVVTLKRARDLPID